MELLFFWVLWVFGEGSFVCCAVGLAFVAYRGFGLDWMCVKLDLYSGSVNSYALLPMSIRRALTGLIVRCGE
jgi:hypothetical protein